MSLQGYLLGFERFQGCQRAILSQFFPLQNNGVYAMYLDE